MDRQKFLSELTELLQEKDEFFSEGEIIKNRVVEAALTLEPSLLSLLLKSPNIKKYFFKEVSGVLVFDKVKFQAFVSNKEFLQDSYTAFKNKIGLTEGKEYLIEASDVVLTWPYKDCVLEGGMTKEDNGHDEIFWNTILAPDDTKRLSERKVLTNWERWDVDAVKTGKAKPVGEVTKDDNLLIKGNNLLALHSLKKRYGGQVKLIYIDPPYNTGKDGFKYNDQFNHSSWLTFMKNRLEIAKNLLRSDGLLCVHCDNNEFAYLKVLMDEIFHRDNFIEFISVVNNPRGRDYGGVANMHEYIIIYSKTDQPKINNLDRPDKEFPFFDDIGGFELHELRNRNNDFNDQNRANLLYPFYVDPNSCDNNELYDISLEPKEGWIKVLPIKSQGIQTVWRWGKEKVADNLNTNVKAKKKARWWISNC